MQIKSTKKGSGKKIVLIHGWAKSASINSLASLQDELANSGFEAWNIELPGFGASEPAPSDWGTPEFSKEVAKFIKSKVLNNKNKKFYLFGHSFGGSISAYIAANLQPKPNAIILCGSAGLRYKTLKALIAMPFAKVGKVVLSIFPKNLRFQIKKVIYYYILRERDYIDTAGNETPEDKARKEQFQKVTNQDLTDSFEKIDVPTLIIWGRDDKVTPLSMGEKIHSLVKDSKLEVIEGRHGVPLKKPQEVAELIQGFVA